MKIAFLLHISLSYYGGGEKWVAETARWLNHQGYEVEVHALPYTLNGKRNIVPKEVLYGIPYFEGWRHYVEADVAYVFYNPLSWTTFTCKCPKIAGFQSYVYFIDKPSLRYGIVPLTARWVYKVIKKWDLLSFEAVHIQSKTLNMRHKKVYCIPNWIDTSIFTPLSNKADRFRVLFVGRNVWQKGWDIFQNVASKLRNEGYDFDFLYIGGTGNQAVKGAGYIYDSRELAKQYSEAHVVLNPSRSDTFGKTIVESLVCGTPVITTPLETHKCLDLPLFYAKETEEFEGKVLHVYNLWKQNNGLYKELCSICHRSSQRYSATQILPKLEKMFREVSGGHQ